MTEQLTKRSMQLFVLDKSFEVVSLCDTFSSLIWTERYSGYGDFELYLPASVANINMFPRGFYLWLIEPFVYDKNGKKIFEGDIVESPNGTQGFIEWQNAECAFLVNIGDDWQTMDDCPYEVVGNIYDNKEEE